MEEREMNDSLDNISGVVDMDDYKNHADECRCKICMSRATSNPIKSTINKSKKYPRNVIIYQHKRSQFTWYTRFRLEDKKKNKSIYKVKSTNQTEKKEALAWADDYFEELLREDLKVISKSKKAETQFKNVALLCLEKEIKLNTPKGYINYRGIIHNILNPIFAKKQIRNIGYHEILNFYNDLRKDPCKFIDSEGKWITRNIKPPTKKNYRVCLKRILHFALGAKYIDRLPEFPQWKETNTVSSRDYLALEEYKQFMKYLHKVMRDKEELMWRTYPIKEDFLIMVRFLINSFLRPSDLKVLKHKHVEIKKDNRGKGAEARWLRLTHPATKTTDTPVITMPNAVDEYEALLQYRKDNPINGRTYIDKEDYLFEPKYDKGEDESETRAVTRKYAMVIMSNQFRMAINGSGIKQKTGKNNITLYSLRHSSIMYRLQKGNVQLLEIARNARTSPMMIDKFYGSHLMPDHVRKAIHSFKDGNAQKSYKKQDKITVDKVEELSSEIGNLSEKEREKLLMQLIKKS